MINSNFGNTHIYNLDNTNHLLSNENQHPQYRSNNRIFYIKSQPMSDNMKCWKFMRIKIPIDETTIMNEVFECHLCTNRGMHEIGKIYIDFEYISNDDYAHLGVQRNFKTENLSIPVFYKIYKDTEYLHLLFYIKNDNKYSQIYLQHIFNGNTKNEYITIFDDTPLENLPTDAFCFYPKQGYKIVSNLNDTSILKATKVATVHLNWWKSVTFEIDFKAKTGKYESEGSIICSQTAKENITVTSRLYNGNLQPYIFYILKGYDVEIYCCIYNWQKLYFEILNIKSSAYISDYLSLEMSSDLLENAVEASTIQNKVYFICPENIILKDTDTENFYKLQITNGEIKLSLIE